MVLTTVTPEISSKHQTGKDYNLTLPLRSSTKSATTLQKCKRCKKIVTKKYPKEVRGVSS